MGTSNWTAKSATFAMPSVMISRFMKSGSSVARFPDRLPAPPGIAQGKIDAAFHGHRHRAVVRTYRLPAEVLFEIVDSGVFRYRFVFEHASPVVAFYSHLLDAQHVSPMKPAISSPDQGAIVAFLISEIG